MKVQQAKQRFGIIGNSTLLDRAINIALQVAPTDISVFIGWRLAVVMGGGTGEAEQVELAAPAATEHVDQYHGEIRAR